MKIKINKSLLTDAPYSEATKQAFYFDDNDDTVEQLVLALSHARPSAYLISGYRGTGKTSLLNRIFLDLKESHLCVNVNLARYDGYPRLVKQLIRHLYLNYEASSTLNKSDHAELNQQFRLLYDRTFHDIVNSKLTQFKEEGKIEHKIEVDWKKVVPYFFIGLAGIGLAFNIASQIFDFLVLAAGILWGAIGVLSTTDSKSFTDSDAVDVSRKSLYDDEIAEHHLFAVLKEFQKKDIKVLVSFDELDKLETKDEITKLVNDLKPLLLSGLTSSFVIAGQSLFYNYEKSTYQDDQVISTLFSKMVHVPFLKNAALKKFCFGLVVDDNIKQNQLLDHFFDSLVLKSSRIPRKLVNLITDKIHWDKEEAYIELVEEDSAKLKIASALLGVLVSVLDRDLPPLTENAVQLDFFIFQLHLWLFKMQQTSGYFTISSVINNDSYQQFPEQYQSRLRSVADVLTDGLLQAGFLRLKYNEEPELNEDEFLWIESPSKVINNDEPNNSGSNETQQLIPVQEPDVPLNEPIDNIPQEQPVFLIQYGNLEKYVNELYRSIEQIEVDVNDLLSLKMVVNRLSDLSVLKKSWYKSSKIDGLVYTRNKLVNREPLEARELDVIAKSAFELSRLRAEINEDFTYYMTRQALSGYNFYETNGAGFDFMGENEKHLIGFEVKTSVTGKADDRNMNEILDKFSNINEIASKESYYVLFYFMPNHRKSFDGFYQEFHNRVRQAGFTYKDRIHLFYIAESDDRGVKNVIDDSLKSLMVHIERAR